MENFNQIWDRLFQYRFFYCERPEDFTDFWEEPFNAVSNLSFVLAAIWVWRSMPPDRRRDWPMVLLVIIGGSIGFGSFLFHTFATVWSSFGDTGPIWIFVALYVFVAVVRVPEKPLGCLLKVIVGVGAAVFALRTIVTTALEESTGSGSDIWNGSEQYLPALVGLVVFAAYLVCRRHAGARWAAGAVAVFIVSLAFRTVDRWDWVCPGKHAVGTHFVWHLLNGLMVGLLLRAMLTFQRRPFLG